MSPEPLPRRAVTALKPLLPLLASALLLALRIYYFFQTSAFRRFPSLQASS